MCHGRREYLTVQEVISILEHFKGTHIVTIPIGKEKMMDGIGEQHVP